MRYEISKDRHRLTFKLDIGEQTVLKEMSEEDASAFLSDDAMRDWFWPKVANGDLSWIEPEVIGALTDAPILGIVRESEAGPVVVSEAWGYMDYQLRSPLEDLRDKGECVFVDRN